MRDKDGFMIKCKDSEWQIIDNMDNKDFVCQRFGDGIHGKHLCFGNEHCKYYEVERRGNDKTSDTI